MSLLCADELLSTAQMQKADAWAMAHGVPGVALMEMAGQAVFHAIVQRWAPRPVLVMCGPGNNGGDGWVVARCLLQAGWPTRVVSMVPMAQLKGDALHHALAWQKVSELEPELICADTSPVLLDAGLVVDALFGAGLARPLDAALASHLQMAAQAGIPLVAIDVPSGLHGDSGQSWGATASTLTVTFFRKKPGHVLMPGRSLCGELVVADIGIEAGALQPLAAPEMPLPRENSRALWQGQWPALDASGHKYQRGHVLAFGGARMVGAARLATRAAARVGAGLVTLAVPVSVWPVYAAHLVSAMALPLADADEASLASAWAHQLVALRWHALVIGPGASLGLPGEAAATLRQLVLTALVQSQQRPVLLDADAVTAFEHEPKALFEAIAASSSPVVLTPHAGEFARLFGHVDGLMSSGKLAQAQTAARLSSAVVVLKGPDTVIASPDGRVVVNTLAPPTLATAGSGDVLAGFITGLMAQGMPAMEAACAGAWLHGACAQAFGPGLLAEDLPEMLPRVLARW